MGAKVESRLLTGDKDLDKENLRILLIKNKTTPTEIARELGVSSNAVSRIIHRNANSRLVLRYLENLPVQV